MFYGWRTNQRSKTTSLITTSPQVTPLCLACMSEAWDSALLLLDRGADPNKAISSREGVISPLYFAARAGNLELCRSLIASGARQDIGREYLVYFIYIVFITIIYSADMLVVKLFDSTVN